MHRRRSTPTPAQETAMDARISLLPPRRRIARLVVAAVMVAHGGGRVFAQAPLPAGEGQPGGPVFEPLRADPKEPGFFATYLWTRSPRLASRLGTVGFGETMSLLRTADWQLAIAAGVFSQFDMARVTADLMNTDYLVGIPLTYRHGALSTRFRLYHQSSHMGDEYMVHNHAERVDLSFEGVEALVARELSHWRAYGGGEYIFARSPADLRPGVLHGGAEYLQPGSLVRLGRLATGRPELWHPVERVPFQLVLQSLEQSQDAKPRSRQPAATPTWHGACKARRR